MQPIASEERGIALNKSKMSLVLTLLLAFALLLSACANDTDATEAPAANDTDAAVTEAGDTEADADDTDVADEPAGDLTGEITVQAEEGWMEYYQAAADRVTAANPDATITLIESGAFDMLDVIDGTGVTNPDVADVFAIPADRIYGLSENDALAAVDSARLAEAIGGWDNFDEGIGGNFHIDGEYLAFPYNIETLIVFANRANAEAAGIDVSQPVEITEIGSHNEVLLPFFDAWFGVALTNSADIELLGEQDGGGYYSDMTKEWSELPAEQQAAMQALYDYWQKHNEAGTNLFDADAGWGYIDDAFTSGNDGVFRLAGPWETGAVQALTNDGADLEILPITHITAAGNPLIHWQGGWGLGINARVEGDQEKMDLAHAMIQEIVNPEHAVELFKATGKILENVDPAEYENSDLDETDKLVIAATINSYQQAPARPLFSQWGGVWDTWKNAVLSWNAQRPATVEDAYAQIKASFDAMMANVQ